MNGHEFLKRLARAAGRRGLAVEQDISRGKGSHRLIVVGSHRTILKDPRKEIGPGLLHKMLRDLGFRRDEL